jgi:hypothetical protein
MLGSDADKWSKKTMVSDDLLVFQREYVFVEYVGLTDDGLIFQLSPRTDLKPVAVRVVAHDSTGNEVINFLNNEMLAHPSATVKRWRISKKLSPGNYRVQIELEGHLAYRANVCLGDRIV